MQSNLRFDEADFTVRTWTFGEETVTCRAYENFLYVKYPSDPEHQVMSLYVPQAYYENKASGGFTRDTAPVFFPNAVGGYMPGLPASPGASRGNEDGNASFQALRRGYVVAAPGARGRTTKDSSGRFNGKAPACIVDLKAAVRYLRANRDAIPGNFERIISNGTSAGGALSALLGATGNHPDYAPWLKEIGAAEERDDIFAASCYCPITNLEQADMAYEWQFHGTKEAYGRAFRKVGDRMEMVPAHTVLTEEQLAHSKALHALFPAYLNSLALAGPDGKPLTLDAQGGGTFLDHVKQAIITSAQQALRKEPGLAAHEWLRIRNGRVEDVDFQAFTAFSTRMKLPFAFDGLNLETPENNLFGTEMIDSLHFTPCARERAGTEGVLADPSIVAMMNPMGAIGAAEAITAKHWRIRHGVVDRDTSLAVPVMLATRLRNHGCEVDFELPWGMAHAGDYDLEELFNWMDQVTL